MSEFYVGQVIDNTIGNNLMDLPAGAIVVNQKTKTAHTRGSDRGFYFTDEASGHSTFEVIFLPAPEVKKPEPRLPLKFRTEMSNRSVELTNPFGVGEVYLAVHQSPNTKLNKEEARKLAFALLEGVGSPLPEPQVGDRVVLVSEDVRNTTPVIGTEGTVTEAKDDDNELYVKWDGKNHSDYVRVEHVTFA